MRGVAVNRSSSRLVRLRALLALAIAGSALGFGGCAMETASGQATDGEGGQEESPSTTGHSTEPAGTNEAAAQGGREEPLRTETNAAPIPASAASAQAAPAPGRSSPRATTGNPGNPGQQGPEPQVTVSSSSSDSTGPLPWNWH
jgi:hypothetical protein